MTEDDFIAIREAGLNHVRFVLQPCINTLTIEVLTTFKTEQDTFRLLVGSLDAIRHKLYDFCGSLYSGGLALPPPRTHLG